MKVSLDEKYGPSATRKFIIIGTSHAGSISAWVNNKYPGLADAAIADTAPVFAVSDFWQLDDFAGKKLTGYDSAGRCHAMLSYVIERT